MEVAGKHVVFIAAVVLSMGQLLGTGLQHYEKGEYDQAVASFTQIINNHTANPYTDDAYYWRGLSYIALKDNVKARQDLIDLLHKFPTSEFDGPAEAKLVELFGGDPAAKATLKDMVGILIQQLGARDFAEREEAAQRLTDMGDIALAAVQDATTSKDVEVSLRATKIVGDIKEKQALAAFDILETRVTLKADQKPLSEVLKEIEKQTGNRFDLSEGGGGLDKPITCDFKDVTFWQAMDQICTENGLYLSTDYRSAGAMRVYPGNAGRRSTSTSFVGCCKFSVQGGNKSFNAGETTRHLSYNGDFWVEPRLRCKQYSTFTVKRAVDDLGNELNFQDQGRGFNQLNGGCQGNWGLYFNNVPNEAREITLVEGSLSLQFPISFGSVEVKDIANAKNATGQGGNYSITVSDVTTNDAQMTVNIAVRHVFDPNTPRYYEEFRNSDFVLVDKKGKETTPIGIEQRGGNSNGNMQEWTGLLRFRVGGDIDPSSLKFLYVSRMVSRSVPVRLEHLPIP